MRPNEEINQQQLDNPKPGDYWHEHFVAQVCVLKVLDNGNLVVVWDVLRDNEGQWFDTAKAREVTRDEFADRVCYKGTRRFCAYVVPERALGTVNDWLTTHKGKYHPWAPKQEPSVIERKVQLALTMPTLQQALTYIVEWEAGDAPSRIDPTPRFGHRIEEVLNRYGKPSHE